jgi:DNA-binding transcriptional LysR family regulator
MSLTLEALEILDAIERRGSFAAAADELGRVPSALTYTVRKLEDDLDVLLFDRSGHRAKLTNIGHTLLSEGRHLLRAAEELECRVKRLSTGWEVELRIAVTALIDFERIAPLIERFYAAREGEGLVATRIKLMQEVLGGAWDALVTGRVDLTIGAVDDGANFAGPELLRMNGGYQTRKLGEVPFVFCVAPHHALTRTHEPLTSSAILPHRGVAIADSSRRAPPRTVGLVPGQDVLTVPSMEAKVAAQVRGLGCGWLPEPWARSWIKRGLLVALEVEPHRPATQLLTAWATPVQGKALKLWLKMLAETETQNMLMELVPIRAQWHGRNGPLQHET